MEKYGSELILTDRKQDDARKARRKSDVLVDNWKEGIQTSQGMIVKIMVFMYSLLESPNSDTDQSI